MDYSRSHKKQEKKEARVSAVRSVTISEQTHLEQLTGQMRHFCGMEASGAEFQQGCLPTDHAIQRIVEDTRVNEEIAPVFRVLVFLREGN